MKWGIITSNCEFWTNESFMQVLDDDELVVNNLLSTLMLLFAGRLKNRCIALTGSVQHAIGLELPVRGDQRIYLGAYGTQKWGVSNPSWDRFFNFAQSVAKRYGKEDADTYFEAFLAAFNAAQGALQGIPEQLLEFLAKTLLVADKYVVGTPIYACLASSTTS